MNHRIRGSALLVLTLLTLAGCVAVPAEETPPSHGIVYESSGSLWLVDPIRGTKSLLLGREQAGIKYQLGLSRDLSQVAYSTNSYDLAVASLDGGHKRQLVGNELRSQGLGVGRAVWAPSDQAIAIYAVPDEPQGKGDQLTLYVVNVSTGQLTKLVTGVSDFAWSGANEHLLASRAFTPEKPGVYSVPQDGSAPMLVLDAYVTQIDVSQDGNTLVALGPGNDYDEDRLLVTDLSSGTRTDVLLSLPPERRHVREARISPDGRRLAFIAPKVDRASEDVLLLMDLQTHDIAQIDFDFHRLVWAPDSQALVGYPEFGTGVYRVDVPTKHLSNVTGDEIRLPMNFMWR